MDSFHHGIAQFVDSSSHGRHIERIDQTLDTPEMDRNKRVRIAPQGLQTHTGVVPQSWTVTVDEISTGESEIGRRDVSQNDANTSIFRRYQHQPFTIRRKMSRLTPVLNQCSPFVT